MARGLRAEVTDVAEHLGQRDERANDAVAMGFIHGLHLATTGVEVTDHGAEEVLGRGDFDGHHRLEDARVGATSGLLEGHRAGELERKLRGVDVVVRAVSEGHLDVLDRVTSENTELHGFLDTSVDRGDVFLRDTATGDGVDEFVTRASFLRLEIDDDATELTGTTGLLLVRVFDLLDLLAEGLAVGHLRLADVRLDLELALHAVDQDVEVELAHACDDRLAGFLVGVDAEGRILFSKTLDRVRELLLVGLRLRLDGLFDDRCGEGHGLEDDRVGRITEGLTGGGVLEAHDGADHARTDLVDLLTLVGVHLVDLADSFLLACGGVEDALAGLEDTGVDADVGQLAEVRISGHLEREDRQGLVFVGVTLHLDRLVAGLEALDGGNIVGRRQVLDDRIEQGLDALVLERGATDDCGELVGDDTLADASLELLGADLFAFEELLGDDVVDVSKTLHELLVPLLGELLEVSGDLFDLVVLTHRGLAAPGQRTHADDVDNTEEASLGTDRDLQEDRLGVQTLTDGLDDVVERSTGAVKFVHVADARNAVLGGLTPHGHGLRLDTGDSVEHCNGTVEDAERTLHLHGEVDVPGGVDDVDQMVFPETGRRGRRDGDAALLLLSHPVHGRRALVGLTDLVVLAGVEEDAFGRRGLTGINVGHDADVAHLGQISHFAVLYVKSVGYRA